MIPSVPTPGGRIRSACGHPFCEWFAIPTDLAGRSQMHVCRCGATLVKLRTSGRGTTVVS